MAVLFSAVTVTTDNDQIEFLAAGIPREIDDLEGWRAFDDLMGEMDYEQEVNVHVEACLYGEGETVKATPEEVAYPENFSTADDYADALKAAKEEMTAAPFVAEQMPSTDQELAQPSNRYRWRKYCEDGSKYGVFPEDYETADDYEDSLAAAKKGR